MLEDDDTGGAGKGLLEQLQALRDQRRGKE